jgi:hypothetical protein
MSTLCQEGTQSAMTLSRLLVTSRVGPGIPPGPLTDPDVNLSIHPARATE